MDRRNLKLIDESVFDLLRTIRRKPPLYLGEKSLTRLHAFLAGYESGLGRLGSAWQQQDVWNGFPLWVAEKLGFSSSTSGWCKMILNRSKDEEAALDYFYELLDEYCHSLEKLK